MAKVLIIDDNEKNIELFKDFVESWGYSTILAYQGQEVIELAKKEKPDAIILDVMLPGMSGYEVCSELKDNPVTRFIPIVMVTALTDYADRVHGFNVGADNFLVKPVNYRELRAILDSLLRKKAWLETMESKEDVMRAFITAVNVLEPEYTIDLKNGKYVYYHRLLRYLRVSTEVRDHILTTAIMLDVGEAIFGENKTENESIKIISSLKLAKATVPLMKYVEQYSKGVSLAIQEDIKNLKLQQEADILVVLENFGVIMRETGEDINVALKTLKESAIAFGYSKSIVAGLEQTITDALFAESLK
ncbi:MAG: response regulator [Acidaminococcaceae bacterium]|nr:response regulator [Acidaminococcaceae bacterium]MDD4722255.1 response regulator [Acidaminococcaceae bacterium]